ncbi:MAG: hypothetical protein MUE40_16680 [Anaerolineae bacterium]|nr:hypothetical protein [Anaerolineae bacterium]
MKQKQPLQRKKVATPVEEQERLSAHADVLRGRAAPQVTPHNAVSLQRTLGNQAVQRLMVAQRAPAEPTGMDLDQLVQDKEARRLMYQFAEKEKNVENLECYVLMGDFSRQPTQALAMSIYNDFVKPKDEPAINFASPIPVIEDKSAFTGKHQYKKVVKKKSLDQAEDINLPGRVVDDIKARLAKQDYGNDLFKKAQIEVGFNLNDMLPRMQIDPLYGPKLTKIYKRLNPGPSFLSSLFGKIGGLFGKKKR